METTAGQRDRHTDKYNSRQTNTQAETKSGRQTAGYNSKQTNTTTGRQTQHSNSPNGFQSHHVVSLGLWLVWVKSPTVSMLLQFLCKEFCPPFNHSTLTIESLSTII